MKRTIRRRPAPEINRVVFDDVVQAVETGEILISPFARAQSNEHPFCQRMSTEPAPLLTFCSCTDGMLYLVGGIEHYFAYRNAEDGEKERYALAQLASNVPVEQLYDMTCAGNAYRIPPPPHTSFWIPPKVMSALWRYSHSALLLDDPSGVYAKCEDNYTIAAGICLAAAGNLSVETRRNSMLAALCECADELDAAVPLSDAVFTHIANAFVGLPPTTAHYARNARYLCALAAVLVDKLYPREDIMELTEMLFATKRRNAIYCSIASDGDSARGLRRRIDYIRDCLNVHAWTLPTEFEPGNLCYADNYRYVYATLDDYSIIVPLDALSSVERAVLSSVSHDPFRYYLALNRYHSNIALFGCAV